MTHDDTIVTCPVCGGDGFTCRRRPSGVARFTICTACDGSGLAVESPTASTCVLLDERYGRGFGVYGDVPPPAPSDDAMALEEAYRKVDAMARRGER
jgi:hypothetical protein